MRIPKDLPELYTKRLIITPLKASDLNFTIKWRKKLRIINTTGEEFEKEQYTIKEQIKWFKDSRVNRIDYIVKTKQGNTPIGVWSFKKFNSPFIKYEKIMEQGRYIGVDNALGMGYAKEVSQKWTEFGFGFLNLDSIVAIHKKNNTIPQKINLKLGFKYFKEIKKEKIIIMKLDKKDYNICRQSPQK